MFHNAGGDQTHVKIDSDSRPARIAVTGRVLSKAKTMFTLHAEKRFEQRVGRLTPELAQEIKSAIMRRRYQCVCPRSGDDRKLIAVNACNRKYFLVCTQHDDTIVTVLTRKMARENIRQQRQRQNNKKHCKRNRRTS